MQRLSLISLVFVALTAAAQTTPVYRVTNLSASDPSCVFQAINDSGVAAGTCSNTMATWTNGTIATLGRLAGATFSEAHAISPTGLVVGEGDSSGNFRPQATISTPGGLLNIDPVSGGNARAIGVLDNGVIFGDMTKSLSGNTASWNVMMWTADPGHPGRYKETILPHYPGGDSKFNGVYAQASNNAGQVAGWVTTSIIGQQGALWNNDSAHTVTVLQALNGGTYAIANSLNDLGQVVGQSGSEAVLWQNDAAHTAVDLGTLPGDTQSSADAINTSGQIVGTSSLASTSRVFLYQSGSMLDLASLVDPQDGFWTIDAVFAINNAGQILAMGSSGGVRANILLTPAAQ